jgi:hypothetical protein
MPASLRTGLVALLAVALLAACGDIQQSTDDTDNVQAKALLLPPNMLVKDAINANEGDLEDWRDLTVFVDSNVTLLYVIGGMGTKHDVVGDITCFDMKSREIAGEPVSPEKQTYELSFEALGKEHYFCRFRVKSGSSAYTINTETKAIVKDPCALCGVEDRCIDGKCIPRGECYPACTAGQECDGGMCVCPKGTEWDTRKSVCAPVKRKGGGAPVLPPPKLTCNPECGAGMVCDPKVGQCVKAAPVAPTPSKGGAKVLSAVPDGSKGSVLTINRGSHHGVEKKQRGTLDNGAAIEVIEVFPFRCRATTKLPASAVKPDMGVAFE